MRLFIQGSRTAAWKRPALIRSTYFRTRHEKRSEVIRMRSEVTGMEN
ncbi:MAG: hypothetical protein OXH57_11150 [Ekhidna sp.]|nr:hypothetical protein [Ekhidna sp.]